MLTDGTGYFSPFVVGFFFSIPTSSQFSLHIPTLRFRRFCIFGFFPICFVLFVGSSLCFDMVLSFVCSTWMGAALYFGCFWCRRREGKDGQEGSWSGWKILTDSTKRAGWCLGRGRRKGGGSDFHTATTPPTNGRLNRGSSFPTTTQQTALENPTLGICSATPNSNKRPDRSPATPQQQPLSPTIACVSSEAGAADLWHPLIHRPLIEPPPPSHPKLIIICTDELHCISAMRLRAALIRRWGEAGTTMREAAQE